MKHGKPIIESSFNNLARIVFIIILFIIFGIITYRIPMSLNVLNRLSIFAVQFYSSILQVITMFFIFKYGFKREDKIPKVENERLETNLFDILIFLFMGLFLNTAIFGGLAHFGIIDIVPKLNTDIIQDLLESMQITNLDKIYSIITGVILAPIVEELFFRKGVFKYFENKEANSRTVVLLSGVSFGLVHSTGIAKIISTIITGIIFAVLYATTKNIVYSIIGHGLNNLMSISTSMFRDNSGIEDIGAYIEAGYLIEIKGVIIISLVLLIITILISYIKRKTIISSDFKDRIREVFTE